jgi:glyoxylase-like metal-dependent hydrolase (beta-lactamase superfamily II)
MIRVRAWRGVTGFLMGRSMVHYVPYMVHAFLVGDTLIDTGAFHARREFMDALAGRRVGMVVNTHCHEDHIGNNAPIRRAFGAAAYAREEALPFIADPVRLGLRLYQRVVWGCPDPSRAAPLGDSIGLSHSVFRVIHTPGHSPDHVCLLEPNEGWLFTGDLFCGRAIRYLRRDEDFPLILSSLKQLFLLDFSTIFCGLKGRVENGRQALGAKIGFMEELQARVMDLRRKGCPPREIRMRILGREGAMHCLSAAHFSKQHVIDSILAQGGILPGDALK